MRVVHIEDFFHPNAGYQINILPKYMVKKGIETYILTAEIDLVPETLTSFFGKKNIQKYDKEFEKKTGVKIVRVPVKAFVSNRAVFTRKIMEKIKELKPDVLYVHGNDTLVGIKSILRYNKLNCALITDSHMLEMASNNRFNKLFRLFYKKIVTPKILKEGITVIRTQNDDYVEKCLGIPLSQAPWISYGSDTLLFYPDKNVRCKFRNKLKIGKDDFVILYAGKLDESKGGLFLANSIEKKFEVDKKIVFLIVGNTNGEYGERVENVFRNSENRVLRFPTQKYMDLAKFYQVSDIAIYPKQCSLSFYDVQASGLPVLLENNNINVDRCNHNNGLLFDSNSEEDFRKKIYEFLNMEKSEIDVMRKNSYEHIMNYYNYSDKADEYILQIYDTLKRYEQRYQK